MSIILTKIPDISQYSKYIQSVQLSSDITVFIIYKTLFRSDDVLVDLYLNEITDNSIITSGKVLVNDSVIIQPRFNDGFKYSVYCYSLDSVQSGLNKYNAHKFHLQFTNINDTKWLGQ